MRHHSDPDSSTARPSRGWWRLAAGILLLSGFILLLATAPLPGSVLRHNHEQDIEATALFYMDLDRMQEIERTLDSLKEAHRDATP